MPRQLKTVMRNYYSAIDYAFKTKDLEPVKRCLAENANFKGVNEFLKAEKASLKCSVNPFFRSVFLIFKDNTFDHESCCTVDDNSADPGCKY